MTSPSDDRRIEDLQEELEAARKALRHSEKMASLGNLVAGVAHEINTPVGSIHSNSDLMVRALKKLRRIVEKAPELETDKELFRVLGALDDIGQVNQAACQRIVSMVKSLKTFARLEEPECRQADIHGEIESALTLVHHELKNRVEIVREFGELPQIECYPSHLNQVFMNLLVNACQAIEGKGRIQIATCRDGDGVCVEFEDSGHGIAEEHRDKVFAEGFTTKGVGVGTGLGLAISSRIVRAHHGTIEVRSTPGEGTTFTIWLPIRAGGEVQGSAEAAPKQD